MRIPGSASALSALSAESIRVTVAAANVSNVSTEGYRAKRVAHQEMRGGGVRASIDEPTEPPGPVLVDEDGRERVLSNVSIESEVVTQISAQRAFEANLAVLRTGDEMTKALIDTKG
jgi:flagellar basal-body rod protein FlgC